MQATASALLTPYHLVGTLCNHPRQSTDTRGIYPRICLLALSLTGNINPMTDSVLSTEWRTVLGTHFLNEGPPPRIYT